MAKDRPKRNLLGQKFHHLLVIGEGPPRFFFNKKENRQMKIWTCLCECDCGAVVVAEPGNLVRSYHKSCGCSNHVDGNKNIEFEPKIAAARGLFHLYKHGSAARSIKFDLTFEQFKEIIKINCYYCNATPTRRFNPYEYSDGKPKRNTQKFRTKHIIDAWIEYNGIDRIDSSRGYEIKNIVPCCKDCNYAKLKQNHDDFIVWIKRIAKYLVLYQSQKRQFILPEWIQLNATYREFIDPRMFSMSRYYVAFRSDVKKDKKEFLLTFETFALLVLDNCHYCGIVPQMDYNVYIRKNGKTETNKPIEFKEKAWIKHNGIDRVDSDKGYVDGNVVACCSICNYAKHTRSVGDFIDWVKRLATHQKLLDVP